MQVEAGFGACACAGKEDGVLRKPLQPGAIIQREMLPERGLRARAAVELRGTGHGDEGVCGGFDTHVELQDVSPHHATGRMQQVDMAYRLSFRIEGALHQHRALVTLFQQHGACRMAPLPAAVFRCRACGKLQLQVRTPAASGGIGIGEHGNDGGNGGLKQGQSSYVVIIRPSAHAGPGRMSSVVDAPLFSLFFAGTRAACRALRAGRHAPGTERPCHHRHTDSGARVRGFRESRALIPGPACVFRGQRRDGEGTAKGRQRDERTHNACQNIPNVSTTL